MNSAPEQTSDAEYWTPPPGLTSELDKYFFILYQAMMKQYREDQEDKAVETAKLLLEDPELPLLYRARCHLLLSTDNENPFFLEHAKEAVRILNEDRRAAIPPEDLPEKELEEARSCCERLKKRLLVERREMVRARPMRRRQIRERSSQKKSRLPMSSQHVGRVAPEQTTLYLRRRPSSEPLQGMNPARQ